VNHFGEMNRGHYTVIARDWDGIVSSATSESTYLSSQWYSFNDENVESVDEKTIKTDAAYILFYRQRE